MVVCKCRKATNLYCFVHKVPVCGECICSSEHQICVVRTYSEWVIDGDYDWPPKCSLCSELLQHGETTVSRLGCLHTFHLSCLSKYLRGFPPHTAPAGYTCPVCSTPVWPPKYIKDHNVSLAMNLKDIVVQSGLSKSLLGNDISASEPLALPAIAKNQKDLIAERNNDQLSTTSLRPDSHKTGDGAHNSNINIAKDSNSAIGDNSQEHTSLDMASLSKLASSTMVNPGAMTRKNSARVDKVGLDYPEYDGEDEDETARKYNRRGPIQKQALKYLLPFSPNALSTLPISAPSRKDDHNAYAEDIIEGRQRRRQRSSGLNTKKILLLAAIMSCMATMLLLYYRLLQGTPSEDLSDLTNNQGQR